MTDLFEMQLKDDAATNENIFEQIKSTIWTYRMEQRRG